MVDEKPQNILLDAEIVGDDAVAAIAATHFAANSQPLRPEPRRAALQPQRDQSSLRPFVFLRRRNAAGEFLPRHRGQRARFCDQLFRGSAIGRDNAAQRSYISKVPDKRARVEIPDDGNAVTLEKFLRGFAGAPIRRERGKFAHDQAFDVRLRGFVIVAIRADISDVRIRQADNLAGIAGIGENFLVTSEAGIENDFAAAARASARRTAVKDSSVLERENRATCEGLRQCVLPKTFISMPRLLSKCR